MSLLGEEPSNQYQAEYNPDLSGKRMDDASKYLPQAEYGTQHLEKFQQGASAFIKLLEAQSEPEWQKHRAAIEAFLKVMQNPISPESLELYKQILESKAQEKFDPYAKDNRASVDMSSLSTPPDESASPAA